MQIAIKLPLITLLLLVSFASVNAVLFTPALPEMVNFFYITIANRSMKTNKKIILISFFILLYTSESIAFDCKKAVKYEEILICSDRNLLQLDAQLNTIFKQTKARLTQDEKKALSYEQLDFLSLRNSCQSENHADDVICLDKLYKKRIAQLISWPNDQPVQMIYKNAEQVLVLNIFLKRYSDLYQAKYLTRFELRNKNNKILNSGEFAGCTGGGIIMDSVDYLKSRNFIRVTPLKNGFAIHSAAGCGGETYWQLNIITPICVASSPASNENGEPISLGSHPEKIIFGYIEGVGASRNVTNDYFTLNENGRLNLSETQPAFKNKVILTCKK